MLGIAVALAKPFVFVWAGLNALDDLSVAMRLARLASVALPGLGKNDQGELCDVCDDVMGDLLVTGGLDVVPCSLACLRIPKCVKMCESVKEASETSTKFPCVAAGYCDASEEDLMETDIECDVGPFFTCRPRKHCRKVRRGFKFYCDLRPGIGRWVGMKNAAASHAGAIADGLLSRPRCGEDGAGPYCIAEPRGWGAVAEAAGYVASILYGGYKSISAIESPGGDDDQQWLTFWLILTLMLFVERFLAQVLLSTFPLYYEAKLAVLCWLLWRNGADTIYRKLRKFVLGGKALKPSSQAAEELSALKSIGKDVVEDRLGVIAKNSERDKKNKNDINGGGDWEVDLTSDKKGSSVAEDRVEIDAADQLYQVCAFLLGPEGTDALRRSEQLSDNDKFLLLERAANFVSFQPRFALVNVLGALDEPKGEMPPMDPNGLADVYVTCRLVPDVDDGRGDAGRGTPYPAEGLSTSTAYRTLRPRWNETIELPLRGGALSADGIYRNDSARTTSLLVEVWDKDVGLWGFALRLFPFLFVCLGCVATIAYIDGDSDRWTAAQWKVAWTAAAVVIAGMVLSYVMAVVRHVEDDLVGVCVVPLGICLDQREHPLLLKLRAPATKPKMEDGEDEKATSNGDEKARTNSVGGLGILRVRLSLSER